MLFVEPFFLLIFLPAAVGVFYAARRFGGAVAALAVIVAASAVFYAPYGPLPAALLAASLVINLVIGVLLVDVVTGERLRRALLAGGLIVDFANLATFKYLDQVAALAHVSRPILDVAIPAGISFYTFHQAVFLVHAYNRQEAVQRFLSGARTLAGRAATLIKYAAFVAFFPQLVIGPITYMSEFGPQVERPDFARLRLRNLEVGAVLVIVGLFKKIVIADGLAAVIDPIYREIERGTPVSAEQALLAIIGYFFQLYFDFSGYSDMALGIAQLFGLRLPQNFDSPLRATGIVDFYRRWHMTLTRVIVVFVFTPLSLWGTRRAVDRGLRGWRGRLLSAWIPLVLNFQIIALWHAAKYTFVAFGLVHGVWYVIETEVRRSKAFRRFAQRTSERLRTICGILVAVVPLTLTFALFRSANLHNFWTLLRSLAGRFQPSEQNPGAIDPWVWPAVALTAVIVYALPNIYEILRDEDPAIRTFDNRSITAPALRLRWRPTLIWGLAVVVLLVVALSKINLPSPFLYGGF
ncbi:MAG TPA: MBOAT family O-acyltransferase [Caulobacteraceae bacterium]